jgi:FkbM family methyltransferase
MADNIKLGALFYPSSCNDKPISFDSLFIPYIYREIYFEGIYVDILNGREDMTIIDVGANIGVVTQHMREHAKKVYAIEPSSEHFEALTKNKEFNNWDNVECFKMAIADKCGEMVIHKLAANRTCNSIALQYQDGDEVVKVMDFETFFKENNIDEVDFIKFDVEGAEDLILRSESFKKIAHKVKAIEVEFHFGTWKLLVDYMVKELGFQARRYQSSAIIVLFTR